MTEQTLTRIMEQKASLRKRLNNLRNDVLVNIFVGISKKKPIRELNADIKKITKSSNIPIEYSLPIMNYGLKISKKANKQIEEDNTLTMALAVFMLFNRDKSYQKIKSVTNTAIIDFEAKAKEKEIEKDLAYNRSLENPKIFGLVSTHQDSATDHRDFQGKYYFDEKWQNYVKDAERRAEIQAFINKHNLKSFQWVTGKPVWMITRPHCRHYFKWFTVDEVLNTKLNQMLINNSMVHNVGKRITQTLAHDLRQKGYKAVNVQNVIREYEERLEYHSRLYQKIKLPEIKGAIDKDGFLIKKWKNYLTKLK